MWNSIISNRKKREASITELGISLPDHLPSGHFEFVPLNKSPLYMGLVKYISGDRDHPTVRRGVPFKSESGMKEKTQYTF